jgi:hypothetical protein
MKSLVIEIDSIANLALEVVKRILAENDTSKKIDNDANGPVPLASALSDFFQMAAGLEQQDTEVETETISEFGYYGLDLLDRLSFQLRQLDIHDQRDNLAKTFASLTIWLARRGASIDNLKGTADAFASLINGEQDETELAALCLAIEEVLEATSEEIRLDEDRSDPWRPWRVLNLNRGIAATRALDPELMKNVFQELGRRLPYDVGGFFADGKRQMDSQNVPEAVREVMTEFSNRWPMRPAH